MNQEINGKEVEKDLFVNIQAPTELRRHLLECSKAIIFVLKNYHKLALLREEKAKLLSILKVQVNEINLLCNKLPNFIPRYTLAIEKPRAPKKKEKKLDKKERIPKENISEIDQLQSALNKIEEKLNTLK
ncbi:MAG: hypothetical protein QXG00_01840 [Candidatus Woesearchaeota archaeon]